MNLNQLKMGVLSDTQLLTYDYRTKREESHEVRADEIWALGQLLDGALYYGINTLWVAPCSWVSLNARLISHTTNSEDFMVRRSETHDATPRFLLAYRNKPGAMSARLAFPEHDTRWPWQHADAETLFRSILYLQDALQFEVAWSPGHTGQELILSLDKHDWLKPINFPDELKRNLAVDWRWKRPLKPEERRIPMYLHLFDGNSKYLAACTGINVGEGDPEHLEASGAGIPFQSRIPGAWHVAGWGWKWTPELEYEFVKLDDEGKSRPPITEAYIWPIHHEAMKAWGRHMWKARQALRFSDPFLPTHDEAFKLAYEALKPCYVEGMGWLAHPSQTGDNKLYRPDIWSMIVAGCKRSMGFKVRQLKQQGFDVCYIDVDTIGIVSESESVEPFRRWLLDREASLGGFKYQGCILLSPDLVETFEPRYKQDATHKAIKAALQERSKGE